MRDRSRVCVVCFCACRFLDSIPKVQSAVVLLEEADGRFIKKQKGTIEDNAMMLERASTKLAGIRTRNVNMGKVRCVLACLFVSVCVRERCTRACPPPHTPPPR